MNALFSIVEAAPAEFVETVSVAISASAQCSPNNDIVGDFFGAVCGNINIICEVDSAKRGGRGGSKYDKGYGGVYLTNTAIYRDYYCCCCHLG